MNSNAVILRSLFENFWCDNW